MTENKKKQLRNCNQEQLIFIIEKYNKALSLISETCVDESKLHISSENAIKDIREYLNVLNEISFNSNHFIEELKLNMNEITVDEYKRIIGLE